METLIDSYYTTKYNNGNSHNLDLFETLDEAIASAKALHHPDWPIWQGICVHRDSDNKVVFDSNDQ